MRYRMKIWTGPACVDQIADAFERAGVTVTCRGTEHVYIVAEGSESGAALHNALVDLERAVGTSFGISRAAGWWAA